MLPSTVHHSMFNVAPARRTHLLTFRTMFIVTVRQKQEKKKKAHTQTDENLAQTKPPAAQLPLQQRHSQARDESGRQNSRMLMLHGSPHVPVFQQPPPHKKAGHADPEVNLKGQRFSCCKRQREERENEHTQNSRVASLCAQTSYCTSCIYEAPGSPLKNNQYPPSRCTTPHLSYTTKTLKLPQH